MRFLILFLLLVPLASCGTTATQAPPPPVNTAVPTDAAATAAPVVAATAVPAADAMTTEASTQPEADDQATVFAPLTVASETELSALGTQIEPVATGFRSPTHVTAAGDDSGRLFVVEQAGTIQIIRDGQVLAQPFLDITSLVGSNGNEQGLLSVAFHPRYRENGTFFVNYTDTSGTTTIARYKVSSDPDRADPASAQVVLTVEQPAGNHNGGLVKFGPDGYLYIGMGDGGGGGDPWSNGQNRGTLLGAMLRIDVDSSDTYTVPADNPFVNDPSARPEVWAWGMRNPWRYSFDRATGDLYIGDVGQNEYEEVDFQPANSKGGENYGWNIVEGDSCFSGACDPGQFVAPVAVYSHGEGGCSVTGGYVYRGAVSPAANGIYFYTDYCTGNLWGMRNTDGTWQNQLITKLDINPSSFGEDDAGELYMTDRDGGGLYRLVIGS